MEAVTKVVASGADYKDAWLTLQEFFERLGTDPKRWGKPLAALLGAYRAQKELGIAAIGGKDSMSGSFENLDVPPTLIAIAVAPTKASLTVSPEFKQAGSEIYLLKPNYNGALPDFAALKENYALCHEMMQKGRVLAAHTIGFGGLAEALAKMSFGNEIGVRTDRLPADFFQALYGGIVLEVPRGTADRLANKAVLLGHTQAEPYLQIGQDKIAIADLLTAWQGTLEHVFPTKGLEITEKPLSAIADKQVMIQRQERFAAPRIVIPVFPGTNCEYDTARAFEAVGGVPEVVVFRNLTAGAIAESIIDWPKPLPMRRS